MTDTLNNVKLALFTISYTFLQNRQIALKIFNAETKKTRIYNEIRFLNKMNHKNIMKIHDYFLYDGKKKAILDSNIFRFYMRFL